MLCYAMLCYAMLCYAMLCNAVLYDTIRYKYNAPSTTTGGGGGGIPYHTILYYTILCYSIEVHRLFPGVGVGANSMYHDLVGGVDHQPCAIYMLQRRSSPWAWSWFEPRPPCGPVVRADWCECWLMES